MGMASIITLDTIPAFERFWEEARSEAIDRKIDSWRLDYLRPWPELYQKQVADYRRQGVDWRAIARRRIFPRLSERLALMRRVRTSIRHAIPIAVNRGRNALGLDFPVTFVIHVGIGCGAGWATTFGGTPAILFGLENATEREWNDTDSALVMVGHELGHLVHSRWREQARLGTLADHRGPWWQLFTEGFATHCELLIGGRLGDRSSNRAKDWLQWCVRNRANLAHRFLKTVTSRRPARRFFGSWYNIDGYVETGYFLGCEVVHDWRSRFSLREIACWAPNDVRRRARASLQRMATDR